MSDSKISTLKTETLNSSQNPKKPHQDRISALPDHILHHILSLLPTKSAVQTSILSNRWCNLWKFVSAIDFDIPYHKETDYLALTRSLLRHKATNITKFSLVSDRKDCPRQTVRQWVSFALLKQVKVLKFLYQENIPVDRKLFAMPDMLYKKDRVHLLEIMYLSSVDFSPRSGLGFSGFSLLKVLYFKYCKVSDEALGVLLSKCLVLEVLSVVSCKGLGNVNIIGPNLRLQDLVFRCVDFCDFPSNDEQRVVLKVVNVPSLQRLEYSGEVTKIHLNKLPNLSRVTVIGLGKKTDNANIGHLRALVNEMAEAFSLGVNSWFLEFMAKEHQTGDSRRTAFQNLKKFIWYGQMKSKCDVVNLSAFLGRCPCLEECQISFRGGICDDLRFIVGGNPEFAKMEGVQDEVHVACLERLRVIKLWHFSGFEGETELVKKLLEKAVALKTMEVFCRVLPRVCYQDRVVDQVDPEIEMELLRKLIVEQVSRFPKASSHCQIVFKSKD